MKKEIFQQTQNQKHDPQIDNQIYFTRFHKKSRVVREYPWSLYHQIHFHPYQIPLPV
jgi:hypothetical protein